MAVGVCRCGHSRAVHARACELEGCGCRLFVARAPLPRMPLVQPGDLMRVSTMNALIERVNDLVAYVEDTEDRMLATSDALQLRAGRAVRLLED